MSNELVTYKRNLEGITEVYLDKTNDNIGCITQLSHLLVSLAGMHYGHTNRLIRLSEALLNLDKIEEENNEQ